MYHVYRFGFDCAHSTQDNRVLGSLWYLVVCVLHTL